MKESFIFHADFIADLPEEYIPTFTMYAVNYGLHGTIPALSGLELALWNKIQRRIDTDQEAWEETKNKRSEAGKLGGMRSGASRNKKNEESEAILQESKQIEANEAKLSNASINEANEAVFVNDNVNEYINVYKSVDGIVNESVNDSVFVSTENTTTTNFFTKNNLKLTRNQIANIEAKLKTEKLPVSFLDFCLEYLKSFYKKKAIDEALFYKAVISFDNLVDAFNKQPKKKEIPKFEKCPSCGSELVWLGYTSRFCKKCRCDFSFQKNKWDKVA